MPTFQELFLAKMRQKEYRAELINAAPAQGVAFTTQTKSTPITEGPFKGQDPEHVEHTMRVLGQLMSQQIEAEFHRMVNVEVPDRSKRQMDFAPLNPLIRLYT